MTSTRKDALRFFSNFIKNPHLTGAIAPSSTWLAKCIVEHVGIEDADVVVEYGPGMGSFTPHILAKMKSDARFFAVEYNPRVVEFLGARFPELAVYEDSVANIVDICARADVEQIDCVISGLPWAIFDDDLQTLCLDSMMEVLAPHGTFTTFTYVHALALPTARKFRARLEERFATVDVSAPVWLNVPPAVCYRCAR